MANGSGNTFDAIAKLRSLMPPEVRAQWDQQEAKEAKYAEHLRLHLAEVIRLCADSLQYPRIARQNLEDAEKALAKALSIAAALDPE